MAETPSTMIPLGTIAPDFQLMDSISGKKLALSDLKSNKATVVMFICNHCPYVKLILPTLVQLIREYQQQEVNFIAINSNDINHYPDDAPDKMQLLAKQMQFTFPYLFDETQMVAKAYHAACTPDFFLFDQDLKCVYRGRFDNATPGNQQKVTGDDLRHALDCLLNAKPINADQKPSVGCNIKWKKN